MMFTFRYYQFQVKVFLFERKSWNPESWLNLFLEFFMKDCTPPTEEKTREGYHGGFEMNRYPPFLLLLLFVVSFLIQWTNRNRRAEAKIGACKFSPCLLSRFFAPLFHSQFRAFFSDAKNRNSDQCGKW